MNLTEETAKQAATYLRFVADLEKQRNPGGSESPGLLRVADLLDPPPLHLYDIAIAAFEDAFESEGKTLGSALDHMLTVLADHVDKFPEIETYATPRALLSGISESLRPGEEEGMIST